MSRFTIGVLGLCLLALLSASSALAVFNPDPGTGGPPGSCAPNDQCCICQADAWTKYNQRVSSNCITFAVNITGWTKALCIRQYASVREQDVVKCTTDGKCA